MREGGLDERLRLQDGRTVLVRDLTAADEPALRRAYASVDPAILRARFGGAVPKLSLLVDKLRQMDGTTHYAAGAFDENGELVGLAQYVQMAPGEPADVAVIVTPDWQRQGIGLALLHHAAKHAVRAGIRTATALVSGSNTRVLELLRDLPGQHTVRYEHGTGTLNIDLVPLAEAGLSTLSEAARASHPDGSTPASSAAGSPHRQPDDPSSSRNSGSTPARAADPQRER